MTRPSSTRRTLWYGSGKRSVKGKWGGSDGDVEDEEAAQTEGYI